MKIFGIIICLIHILAFVPYKILAQEEMMEMPVIIMSSPIPVPTETPVPIIILTPTIEIIPTPSNTPVELIVKVEEECNPNICHPLYGCTMNRCSPDDPIQTNCTLCGPLGLGYDQNCQGLCVTPTPKPVEKPKFVLIPGYGASWNTQAFVWNMWVADSEWKILSLAKNNYSGFEDLMSSNNYVINKDYYIWAYDWRRPVDEIAYKFKRFYDSHFDNDDNITIVGHSLGGLVARIFAHDYPKESVKKIITVGTPHKGAMRAYDAWAWGTVDGNDILSKILRLYIEMRRINSTGVVERSKSEAVHLFAPVMKDLIPEYNYLKFSDHLYNYLMVEPKNSYLIGKNQEINWNFGYKLVAIVGIGKSTKEYVDIGKGVKNVYDYSFSGDNTVLQKSAGIGNSIINIVGNHGTLVNESITEIAAELGMQVPNMYMSMSADNNNNDVMFFAYPGTNMTVECSEGNILHANQEGIIMVSKTNDQCKVKAMGLNGELPRVLVGRTDFNADWMLIDEEEKIIRTAVLTTFKSTREEFDVLPLPQIVW